MLWECDCCGRVVEDDPHAHSDRGGEIVIYGPHCCDQPMTHVPGRLEGEHVVEDDEEEE